MTTATLSARATARATAPAPIEGFDPDEVDATIKREIGRLTDARLKLATLRRRITALSKEHDWPEGATLRMDSWNLNNSYISVTIPHDPDRPWRGLNGTAGIVYKVRRFFNCTALRRQKISYNVTDPSTVFWASVQIDPDDPRSTYQVNIVCQGQIPDTCHLEEVIDTTPRKAFKIVCGPAAEPAATTSPPEV